MQKSAASIFAPSLPGRRSLTPNHIRPPTSEHDIRLARRNTKSTAYSQISTGVYTTTSAHALYVQFTLPTPSAATAHPRLSQTATPRPATPRNMPELWHLLSLFGALCLGIALVDVPGLGWLVTACDIYLAFNVAIMWMAILG
ncbi:hypothetical protein P171DRAFT_488566 [Karstenula rhodostoma CBS 690.94]|uniref:Uncharacterized protein n=1 Tax=Karstenula rhodostoma CBS 690.94 TaxID=1392251 RepID=A0A9P4PD55_9PLEO|nr:hypothetical protein P171DRAFT_488566 [Karstenula rhodostoma CBS 690.94]